MERHGLGLVQAIKNFNKLDSVLREFFGAGADGLEQKFLQEIIDVENSKPSESNWVSIRDPELSRIFLESFADQDKKAVLGSVTDEPLIIANILETCGIPQTSGYRKINFLINNGLLIANGFELSLMVKKSKNTKLSLIMSKSILSKMMCLLKFNLRNHYTKKV